MWLNELNYSMPGTLVWLGTQCSSFLLLCRKQSQRYSENGFLGDDRRAFVRRGNRLMVITSLVFFLAYLVDAVPALEQPVQSMLPKVRIVTTTKGVRHLTKSSVWQ